MEHEQTNNEPYYLNLTWERIYEDTTALVAKIKETGKTFEGIIAITRGGMVPAGIVAEQTGLRTIDTLCMSSYDHKNQRDMQIIKQSSVTKDGTGWLIIDDLSDTGNTFRTVREMFPGAHLACIYVKPAGRDTADTYVTEVEQNCWINFPWAPKGS